MTGVMTMRTCDYFFGLFSVVGKGRPNFPLRFLEKKGSHKEGSTIILYYEELELLTQPASRDEGGFF